ncbi:MAG: TetR/AcrR family transcriptional regulator [Actinomycetota bacterium]|nr:TetR/AcrR family transcriptional regulator [Actinomycetota bacterium]
MTDPAGGPAGGAEADRRPGRPRDPGLDAAILAATVALLCEQGFTGTSVEAVAERAGVSKATIYRRWPTREDLLLAAGSEMGPCPSDPDTGDLREDLLVLLGGLVTTMRDSPIGGLLPATVDEAARNPELRTRLDAYIQARRGPVRAALDRAGDRGELRQGLDHGLLADLLAGPVFTRLLVTGGALEEDLPERIVDLVLSGALARP